MTTGRRTWLTCLLLIVAGWPAPVTAQTGALVSVEVQIYAPGVDPQSGQPTLANSFALASAQCNQPSPPMPTTTVFNPRRVALDDPANAGRACIADQSTLLLALPVVPGQYVATMTVTDDRGLTSPRSAASNPFGRATPPSAPTGLRIVP